MKGSAAAVDVVHIQFILVMLTTLTLYEGRLWLQRLTKEDETAC